MPDIAVAVVPNALGVPARGAVPAYWEEAQRFLAEADPVIAALIEAHPHECLRSRGDPFQTLMRSIVGQQISLRAADSVWARLCQAAPPRPETVLALGPERLRACGLSQRKTEYILDLARRFVDGGLHVGRWAGMDDEAVIAELMRVRGIGRWTAEMFLMFNLLRPDVLPVDDLGLRRAVGLLYFGSESADIAAVRHVAAHWAPWRSVATWYLWRALDPVPVEY
ncbi:MAG: DNA-3-methyladenine glycosylase 2 family protein [Burkholderiales bacterium]|nr:DNA-3-methyladenine glycosylase 2 family protein [Burkholderiales bacterium]